MPYIGTSPSNGVRRVHTYTATASQTTFSGASSEGVTLSYADTNYIDVFQNGVLLGSADYTSTSGTSVVLAQGASADDLIVIVVYDVFSVADTVSKTNGGSFDSAVTFEGDITATNSSGNRTLGIITGTSNSSIINLGDTDASNVGQVKYHHGVNSMVLRTNSTDKVTLDSTGNMLFNQSGTGIYLGTTSATASNLLDDYEEGTWTPTLGGNTTYISQEGSYRKVGSLVFVFGLLKVNAIGTGSTQVISGLPFASGSPESTIPLSKLENSSFNFYSAQLRTSGSTLYLSAQTALDGSIAVNQNYFQNNTEIQFSGSYIT